VIVAHVFGLPVEETIPQLVPAGVAAFVVLLLTRVQTCRWRTRLGRLRGHQRTD
jgi:hypothetical protein